MSTLDKAIQIAAKAHEGQMDRQGQPYILHPLRVMLHMQTNEGRIAAVLHDVVEDSTTTLDDLRQAGFTEFVVQAVDAVSRRDGEDYMDFVKRSAQNPLGKQIKLADLHDNMDLRRICTKTEKDQQRLERYHQAWLYLTRNP
ncbi:HD domain-containing protein [Candidatus Sumerlaeota bacterium]|nr:HD domain-containing protein [Candidatus Sumerlaeota bacterium]